MKKHLLASLAGTALLVAAGCSTNKEEAPKTEPVVQEQPTPEVKKEVVTKYKLGDKIQAKWKGGSYYPGTIAMVNTDGTYNINYDDGDKESNVMEANIKLPEPVAKSTTTFKAGDKVKAKWKGGSYYTGTIATVNADGTYNIDYDDGDKESNVMSANIMLLETEAKAPVTYKVGDKVKAQWQGGTVFFNGTIATVNTDGTYNIDYDDGDKESNVPASKIEKK
jgi:hypothetical protein